LAALGRFGWLAGWRAKWGEIKAEEIK